MSKPLHSPSQQALCDMAYTLFEEYLMAYAGEWQRLDKCERMYLGDHWHDVPMQDPNEPRPVTPIIQSTIENVSADLMDQYPEAIITPEHPRDARTAQVLQAAIAQNHDAASYQREYLKLIHDLLVGGYMVQEVGYDNALNGGLGGSFIRHVDNRSILFDPLCTDIQDGRAVIKFSARTRQWLQQHYPHFQADLASDSYSMAHAVTDQILCADRSKTLLFIEYWWREFDPASNRTAVHMAQFAGGVLLADSRTDKPGGYFLHGQYPFIVTPLFPRKGSALGFGFVDMFETQQRFSDKLDQIVLKNALMASHNKLLVTDASGFDIDDLRDWSKEVHKGESLNGITWFSTPPLPAYIMNYIASIRNGIKEESGSNDFSRGGTIGGVTAASAIAALQEMSSKRARMASTQMHEAFRDAVRMEIETEREFHLLKRELTLSNNGKTEVAVFDPALFFRNGAFGSRIPVEFFVSIKVQRQNRFNVASQNELYLQMLSLGVIDANQALELMHFDGKELVLSKAKDHQNRTEHPPDDSVAQRSVEQPSSPSTPVSIPQRLRNLIKKH